MGPVRLGVGTEWLLDGRVYRIIRRAAADRFAVLDVRFNTETELTESEILSLYTSHRLRFPNDESHNGKSQSEAASQAGRELSATERQELERRWQAIEPLVHLSHRPATLDFQRRAEELRGLELPISARSLRRYWTMWTRSHGDRMALLPKTQRRGNRGRTRRNSQLRRWPVLTRLVQEAIQDVYLTTARRPIAAVVRRVIDDLQRHNARLPAPQAVPVPRFAALSRAVSRRIAQLDPWEVDRARWGRRIADRRHQPTTRQQLATRILERVEIDHSPLKAVVGTAAGPIGQPWITVLIDYYSRMITGFCIGFEPPSYAVIMEALRQAILPKTGLRARPPAIAGEWPCYGVPEKIVCDRGSDFTSRDLEEAAFQLGIELDFMPPRMPHLKGTVESFFDTLNDQLVSALPGRTFRSWQERADYNADLGPFLPYEALVEIIQIHLIEVYAVSKHPTTALTRLEMWQESAAEFPPCLPASPDELVVLLAKRVDRMLSVRGIELGGMFYQCDELMALRAELAVNNLPCDRLQVRYNPWDLGEAWVLNPLSRQHIRVPAVDMALQGMTEHQWRVLKRAIRERFDEPEYVLSLAAARNSIRDLAEATMTTPSPKRRVRAARLLQHPLSSATSESTESSEPLDSSFELSGEGTDAPGDSDMGRVATQPQGQAPPSTPQRPDDCNPPQSDPFDLDVEDWGVAC